MSGFVLVAHFDGAPFDPAMQQRMTDRIAYRGPDHHATWASDDGLAWGTVAVHAVTYEDAHDRQPTTRDGVTVFSDSRLDARPDLVRALKSAGQDDASTDLPDSELVLRAYLAFGERCTDHLIGDFAFALYDARARRVFAVRDHMGIRALYVARKGASLVVSTELTAVRYHPAVTDTLDDVAVGDFLLFGTISWLDKERSIFEDIRRVPGAHALDATPQNHQVRRYWALPVYDKPLRLKTEQDYVEVYGDALRVAVKDRMRSARVRVGLSGGIDSAVIATVVTDLLSQGHVDSEVTFLTTCYDRIHPDTEAFFSRLTAQQLGISQMIVPIDDYHPRGKPNLVAEPSLAISNNAEGIPSPLLDFGSVGLNGQGGDELLVSNQLFRRRGFSWKFWHAHSTTHPTSSVLSHLPWLNADFVSQAQLGSRWQRFYADVDRVMPMVRSTAHHFLSSADWCFAAEDLSGLYNYHRVTLVFLDLRLLTHVLQMPDHLFRKHKWLSRRFLAGRVPRVVLDRPKVPLGHILASFRSMAMPLMPSIRPQPLLAKYTELPSLHELTTAEDAAIGQRLVPHLLNYWLSKN